MKNVHYTSYFIFIAFILLSEAVSSQAPYNTWYGVNAGTGATGYYNTGVGYNSQSSVTSGTYNTSVGSKCMPAVTSGNYNSAAGYGACGALTTGQYNVGVGSNAFLNGNGSYNIAVGANSLNSGPGFGASYNTAVGYRALQGATGGQYNVAVGYDALLGNSTGNGNTAVGYQSCGQDASTYSGVTAVGWKSLVFNTTGNNCTALGYYTLGSNYSGTNNQALGYEALYTNYSGNNNTAVGSYSLYYNTSHNNNAFGVYSLYNNTSGLENDAFGDSALFTNTTGCNNVAIGNLALAGNGTSFTGSNSTAVGVGALSSTTTAGGNTAVGYQSLAATTNTGPCEAFGAQSLLVSTGNYNVGMGYLTLYSTTTGSNNAAIGTQALHANTTGWYNIAFGQNALHANVTSYHNTAVGYFALGNSTGSSTTGDNTAVGNEAGQTNTTGTANTFLGSTADVSGTGQTNATALGYGSSASTNELALGNGAVNEIFAFGALHTSWSDKRFKFNITEDVKGLDFILKLRPVVYNFDAKKADEFRLKNRPDSIRQKIINSLDYTQATSIRQSGFIAQEVAEAAKESGYDFNGVITPKNDNEAYRLSYSQFVVPLVKAVQEQNGIIERRADTIAGLMQITTQQDQIDKARDLELSNAIVKMELLRTQLQTIKECCSGNINQGMDTGNIQLTSPQLLNAVPNPSSNLTSIYYYVPQTSNSASIQLADANGVILQRYPISALGYSSLEVHVNSLASGIYYYSLIVNDKLIATKKLSVITK